MNIYVYIIGDDVNKFRANFVDVKYLYNTSSVVAYPSNTLLAFAYFEKYFFVTCVINSVTSEHYIAKCVIVISYRGMRSPPAIYVNRFAIS